MAPRRPLLLLLSAIALLVASSAVLIPRGTQAAAIAYTVDTTADLAFDPATTMGTYCKVDEPEDCSLRRAIGEANRDGEVSTIAFDRNIFTLPPVGDPNNVGTITLNPELGSLLVTANDLTIDAQPTAPLTSIIVRLDGAGASFSGLRITSSNVKIYGLSVTGFNDPFLGNIAGVHFDGPNATNNLLSGSRVGVLPGGNAVVANHNGVLISGGAANNQIRNSIIGGNRIAGVLITNASNNTIASSGIGIGAANEDLGNDQAGVIIFSESGGTSSGNIIGGVSLTGDANTISGNGPSLGTPRAGVLITGAGSTGNFIYANRIGLNLAGGAAVPNSGDGIRIENGASNTTIGGATPPLIVSGNSRYGITITGVGTANNTINGNVFVGLNNGLTSAVPNSQGGIVVSGGATGTTVNGSTVAGNTGPGVLVSDSATSGTTIRNSFVGRFTSSAVLRTVPNTLGIQIAGALSTSVLTTTIGNNTQQGLLVQNAGALTATGNTISTNGGDGFLVQGAGALTATGNTISTNGGGGFLAQSTGPITVTGNTISTNNGDGVRLLGPRNVIVRTNTITANLQSGLVLSGTLTSSIANNTIGNQTQTGLILRGATANTVQNNTIITNNGGGLLLETGPVSPTVSSNVSLNTISGNQQFGLRLNGTVTTTLLRNYIGLNTARTGTLPNTGNGVELLSAVATTVIDMFIAGNTGAGMVVTGANTRNTTINNSNIGFVQSTVDPFGYTIVAANGQEAIRIGDGALNTEVSGGVFGGAGTAATSPAGILIQTSAVTVSGTTIGGVKEVIGQSPPTLKSPFGPGIDVTGPLTNVQLLDNTLRFNKGPGIRVTGNAQRVRMLGNKLAENGGGIDLAGTSLLPVGGPGSLTNPNHDIDPPVVDVDTFSNPLRLQVSDLGVISGFVITSTAQTENTLSPPSACNGCTIQLFAPDEGLDEIQGWTVVGTNPVGDLSSEPAPSFQTNADGSYTRQLVGGLDVVGSRLLLVATDTFGNSSTYGVFPIRSGFILENLSGNQTAAPGSTVTYTLRLSNTGTLDMTGLKLETSGTLSSWGLVTNPVTDTIFTIPTALLAGSTRLITVSLTLPKGPNSQVTAGTKDVTTVRVIKDGTAISRSVQLETTVLPAPVLSVLPRNSTGKAKPNEQVPHTHTIRNDGNVGVTINLSSTTLDRNGVPNLTWATTLTPPTFTLGPGQERPVRVDVLVPNGAQVTDDQGNPIFATTYVTATVPFSPTGGFGPVSVSMTDTTQVDFDADAILTDSDQEQSGAAGEQVVFTHFVRNESNAPTSFCFIWSTNLGSTVTFESRTNGFVIDANGCFSLDTTPLGRQAQFDAKVLVDERLLPGDREIINISLRNVATGETIGSAKIVNRINVLIGLIKPRVYIPLVVR